MRIGSFGPGGQLAAQHSLLSAISQLNQSQTRLATMRRINQASDDPAGLVASEQLLAELEAVKAAGYQASRTQGTIHQSDAAMAQVGSLLNDIQGHVVAAAGGGLSDEEIAARQMEVDAAMEAINRIGQMAPDVEAVTGLDLTDLNTAALGNDTGSLAELGSGGQFNLADGDLTQAQDILDAARQQVSENRVKLGAYEKYTLQSSQEVYAAMELSLTSAVSMIRDADVAVETSNLMRAQILTSASLSAVKLASGQQSMLLGNL